MTDCFYFAYEGNKRTENKLLINYLDLKNIKNIVEPFCGSSSFSRWIYKNYDNDFTYYSNDINSNLISFLKNIKEKGCKQFFDFSNEKLKDITIDQHKEIVDAYKKDNSNPFLYWYYHKIYTFRKGIFPSRCVNKIQNYNKYTTHDEFYKKCNLSSDDYKIIMEKFKDDQTAIIYLDPPYFNACNTYYAIDQSKKLNL